MHRRELRVESGELRVEEKEVEKTNIFADSRVSKFEIENLKTKTKIHIDMKGAITELLKKFKIANFAIGSSAIALVIGGFTISASAGALPGDPLYSLKLSMEKVQVALTLNKKDSIRLQVDITGKRIDELSKVLVNNTSDQKVAEALVNTINNDLANIPDKVSSLTDDGSTTKKDTKSVADDKKVQLQETAKLVDDKMSEYDNKLKEVKKVADSNGLTTLGNEIDNIGIKGNHVSVKTLNIVVQNINANNLDEKTKQDIVDRVGKKIDNIKAIVGTEEDNSEVQNLVNSQVKGYGYGNEQGGKGTTLVAQLDDIKTQLDNMNVGSASLDDMSLIMNDIEKQLSISTLTIVNANDKLNEGLKNAIDLSKKVEKVEELKVENYGYAQKVESGELRVENYGYGTYGTTEKEPEVKAEGMVDSTYGKETDVKVESLWAENGN